MNFPTSIKEGKLKPVKQSSRIVCLIMCSSGVPSPLIGIAHIALWVPPVPSTNLLCSSVHPLEEVHPLIETTSTNPLHSSVLVEIRCTLHFSLIFRTSISLLLRFPPTSMFLFSFFHIYPVLPYNTLQCVPMACLMCVLTEKVCTLIWVFHRTHTSHRNIPTYCIVLQCSGCISF